MTHRIPSSTLIAGLVFIAIAGGDADARTNASRVASSHLLTETELHVNALPHGPAAVATADGWCVAWSQRGALFVTRIGAGGELRDPTGLAIAEHSGARIALESNGQCVIVNNSSGYSGLLEGFLIPSDSEARPVPHFTLINSGPLVWSGTRRMLFWENLSYQEGRFRLFDSDARLLAASPPLGPTRLPTPHRDGFVFLLEKRQGSEIRELELWRLDDALQPHRLFGPIAYESGSQLALAASDDEILLVTHRSGAGAGVELRRFTPTGEPLGTSTIEPPDGGVFGAGSLIGARIEDSAYVLLWRTSSESLAMETDGVTLLRTYSIAPPERSATARRGSTALHVWGESGEPLGYAIAPERPSGPGIPLSYAPVSEVLLDSAEDEQNLVLLWYELHEHETQLWLAVSPKSDPSVQRRLLVRTETWLLDDREIAIALRNGVAIVAWTDETGLLYRRADLRGTWIDPAPRILRPMPPGPHGLIEVTREGVVANGGGFVLTWAEWMDGTQALKAAILSPGGGELVFDLTVDPETLLPTRPSIVETETGYVVAWHSAITLGCTFGPCPLPMHRVQIAAYDGSFVWMQDLTPEQRINSSNPPQIVRKGDEILLFLDGVALLYRRRAGGSWGDPQTVSVSPPDLWRPALPPFDLEAIPSGYFAVHQQKKSTVTTTTFTSATMGYTITSDPPGVASFALVEDWSGGTERTEYVPQIIRRGEQLLLFGSEISDHPDDGHVRRLRMHVLEPAVKKMRPVRRSPK